MKLRWRPFNLQNIKNESLVENKTWKFIWSLESFLPGIIYQEMACIDEWFFFVGYYIHYIRVFREQSNQIKLYICSRTCKMDNLNYNNILQFMETELAETLFSRSPMYNYSLKEKYLLKKKKNYTNIDLEMLKLLAERG